MRVVLQRVSRASVTVAGQVIGAIEKGTIALVGFGRSDTSSNLEPLARKLLELRIFANESGRFDRSLLDLGLGVLLVPQFTLYADTAKGRRPDFGEALEPEAARKLFDEFVVLVRKSTKGAVETGRFGAHMLVSLENDGPVTLILEG